MRVLRRRIAFSFVLVIALACLASLSFVLLSQGVARGLNSAISSWFAGVARRVQPVPGRRHTEQPWTGRDSELAGLAALEERAIAIEVYAYFVRTGTLPHDIIQVKPANRSWKTSYPFEREITVDPWGNPYLLRVGRGSRFFIISPGLPRRVDLSPDELKTLESLPIGRTHRMAGMIVYAGDVKSQDFRK